MAPTSSSFATLRCGAQPATRPCAPAPLRRIGACSRMPLQISAVASMHVDACASVAARAVCRSGWVITLLMWQEWLGYVKQQFDKNPKRGARLDGRHLPSHGAPAAQIFPQISTRLAGRPPSCSSRARHNGRTSSSPPMRATCVHGGLAVTGTPSSAGWSRRASHSTASHSTASHSTAQHSTARGRAVAGRMSLDRTAATRWRTGAPCCAMLCCAVLCYATLCYAMLCYAMLCRGGRSRYEDVKKQEVEEAERKVIARREHSIE